jgi:hypothetical protein
LFDLVGTTVAVLAADIEHPTGKDFTDERINEDVLLDIGAGVFLPGIVDPDVGNGFHVDVIVVGIGPIDGLVVVLCLLPALLAAEVHTAEVAVDGIPLQLPFVAQRALKDIVAVVILLEALDKFEVVQPIVRAGVFLTTVENGYNRNCNVLVMPGIIH